MIDTNNKKDNNNENNKEEILNKIKNLDNDDENVISSDEF